MSQRVILVTGANGGLGQAIAAAFCQNRGTTSSGSGCTRVREAAEKLAQANAGRCQCVSLDVTSVESWQKAVEEVLARHGRLDVLVNNAGSMPMGCWNHACGRLGAGPGREPGQCFSRLPGVLPAMISQRADGL